MASGHSSRDASRPAEEREVDPRASASKSESRVLLDQVLQATLELSRADEPLRPEELRSLVAVARRRRDDPLTLEIVAELVEAVLRLKFRRVVESSAVWDRMTQQIATTIFDDPRSREAMGRFWDRLREAGQA